MWYKIIDKMYDPDDSKILEDRFRVEIQKRDTIIMSEKWMAWSMGQGSKDYVVNQLKQLSEKQLQ